MQRRIQRHRHLRYAALAASFYLGALCIIGPIHGLKFRPNSIRGTLGHLPGPTSQRKPVFEGRTKNEAIEAEASDLWVDEYDVRYWSTPEAIYSGEDRTYQSPLADSKDGEGFVTFEPDIGMLNNLRLHLEICVAFSAALNRTLVIPHTLHGFMCRKEPRVCRENGGRYPYTMYDLFDFSGLEAYEGLIRTMPMATYIERYAPANITVPSGHPPPNFDKKSPHVQWIRNTGYVLPFGENMEVKGGAPGEPYTKSDESGKKYRYIAFPAKRNEELQDPQTSDNIRITLHRRYGFLKDDDAPYDIMRDPRVLDARAIHFGPMNRILGCWYCLLFFEDDSLDRRIARLIRDGVRYPDPVFDAAHRIVRYLKRAHGEFDAMHVRRTDFFLQYKNVFVPATRLLRRADTFFVNNRAIFVATGEKNHSYFDPVKENYPHLYFLSDFDNILDTTPGFEPFMMKQVDQIVASHGRRFVGTYMSTFSAYILRLRGYLGKANNTATYVTNIDMTELGDSRPCGNPWASEYPSGWSNLGASVMTTHNGQNA